MNKSNVFIVLSVIFVFLSSCKRSVDKDITIQNIVVIVSDDHSYTSLGCYGNNQIKTPNIDKLAQNGVRFTNTYCNSPLCSASRQSMLTGKYPHSTGVSLLFTPFNDDANFTIAEYVQQQGYKTCLIGKSHFNEWIYSNYWDEWPDYGFDTIIGTTQWQENLKRKPALPIPSSILVRDNNPNIKSVAWQKNASVLPQSYFDRDAEGTFFAGSAIQFLKQNKNNPFFLWLAFHEPHAPFAFPIEYSGMYNPEDIVLPVGSDEDNRWVPEIFKNLSDKEKRGIVASYYTSVSFMDKNVGMVLEAIDQLGLDKNTIVIYVSDNGYLLYDHKRFEKHTMWKESVKIPLIIKGKGYAPETSAKQLVELIDLAPTICEAIGLAIPNEIEGKSLVNVLNKTDSIHKEWVFSEYLEDNMMMIANNEFKYVFTIGRRELSLGYKTGNGASGVYHALYDLKNDLREIQNLAYKPEWQPTLSMMQEKMLAKLLETHPNAQQVPTGLNTIGKLIYLAEPTDIGDEPGADLQRIFNYEKN